MKLPVLLLVLLTGCATPWPRHCQRGCNCNQLDTREVCRLHASGAFCACRDYPAMRDPQWHFTDAELEQIVRDVRNTQTNSVLGPITFPSK